MQSTNQEQIGIVKRAEIPSLKIVEVEGRVRNLGILKDLRRNETLASLIPEQGRLSLAWVSLKPGEQLEVHEHPTASMIVMTAGEARVMGDMEGELQPGDILAVPPAVSTGLRAKATRPFGPCPCSSKARVYTKCLTSRE
ncbi:MAG: hypothetical protein V3V08_17290 [Nannocystaceae bacterium]